MGLAPGARFGSCEIAAQIGVGGMGEVYRARDLKLNREVALKVLPDSFVNDPDRLARFQREAHVLASLNHPNIAAIYGVEESSGVRALVMELVEGPTLGERIAEGPIPIDEATGIAAQIAEALGAAHDQGVVHRDLKPANIKVKPDGTVKVLDFGLAKAVEPAASSVGPNFSSANPAALSQSPTITTPAMTQIGVLLGTAAYMSPEQAKGRAADKRSDVWAFGCVFYEMLTGTRAFAEEDISETLAAVLKSEPDWTRIPSDVPHAIRTLIQRCLVKDRRLRVADISAAKFVLCELGNLGTRPATANLAAAPRSRWQRVLPPLAAAAVTAAIVGAGMWMLRPVPRALARAQFSFALPEGQILSSGARQAFAISPDGTHIAYAANSRLFLRPIGEFVAHPIPGTEGTTVGAVNPLFSPDGDSVAFFSMGETSPSSTELRRVPIGGGAASPMATLTAPFGGSWGPDGILIGQGPGGIVRVSERGGAPELVVRVGEGESAYGPQMLPDGQTVLFTLGKNVAEDGWDKAQIVSHSLKDRSRRVLIDGGADARYLQSGHLVYAVAGTVFAAPLDVETLTLTGPAVPVVVGVRRGGSGRLTAVTQVAFSDTGTLVYLSGPATGSSALRNVVLEATPLKLRSADYVHPRVSPNGRVLAVGQNTGRESDIWTYDLSEQTEIKKLTFGGSNRFPVWSGDGRRVTFQSGRDGDRAIFWQSADGAGDADRLTKPEQGEEHIPESWSRDGKRLLFSVFKDAKFSLWVWTLDGQRAPIGNVLSNSPLSATFSPDGRWIAYAAGDAGGMMSPNRGVFVQPFPATGEQHQAPKRVIDFHPLWAPDGKSIFYVPSAARSTVSVPITTRPAVAFGRAVELPRAPKPLLLAPDVRGYDVLPDGRFISVVPTSEDGSAPMTEFRVVLNWFEELKRLAPVK